MIDQSKLLEDSNAQPQPSIEANLGSDEVFVKPRVENFEVQNMEGGAGSEDLKTVQAGDKDVEMEERGTFSSCFL